MPVSSRGSRSPPKRESVSSNSVWRASAEPSSGRPSPARGRGPISRGHVHVVDRRHIGARGRTTPTRRSGGSASGRSSRGARACYSLANRSPRCAISCCACRLRDVAEGHTSNPVGARTPARRGAPRSGCLDLHGDASSGWDRRLARPRFHDDGPQGQINSRTTRRSPTGQEACCCSCSISSTRLRRVRVPSLCTSSLR